MMTPKGPQVLEFNCRLGDPETQPLLLRLKSDLLDMIEGVVEGRLGKVRPDWDERASVCIVMASGGYPGSYDKGKEIKGLDQALALDGVGIFHAGTKADGKKILTAGGRVLGLCALGDGIGAAIPRAYEAAEKVSWPGLHYRRDIGQKALDRPLVGLVLGSDSDWPVMKAAAEKLADLGLPFEARVLSAHRTPEEARRYAREAASRGLKVLIAAAGGAAHLAGVLAGQTVLPVIGVPLAATPLGGMDALLATVQMPPGVPVATVGLDKWGAINAAILAAQVLATGRPELAKRLADEKEKLKEKVKAGEERLKGEL